MTMTTARHGLPLLVPGQAQKEVFHNESLTVIDALLAPVVEAVGIEAPPPAPATGESWIVGDAPSGAWLGRAHALATWTAGGWRYQAPTPRMRVTVRATGQVAEWDSGSWTVGALHAQRLMVAGVQVVGPRAAAIPDAVGGATVDGEARAAINAVLGALRTHGLVA